MLEQHQLFVGLLPMRCTVMVIATLAACHVQHYLEPADLDARLEHLVKESPAFYVVPIGLLSMRLDGPLLRAPRSFDRRRDRADLQDLPRRLGLILVLRTSSNRRSSAPTATLRSSGRLVDVGRVQLGALTAPAPGVAERQNARCSERGLLRGCAAGAAGTSGTWSSSAPVASPRSSRRTFERNSWTGIKIRAFISHPTIRARRVPRTAGDGDWLTLEASLRDAR